MSTTIDQRVVEMRFDNRHFETNVAHTMSTVEKLKQKLNFSGTAKGIENIDSAVKKVDMSGLGGAVDTVRARFSALEVMGVTALANITNSAVNAGKRIASALTIQPVKTGFQEYETQMNSIQTILANTQSKGSTLDDVNQALDTLNKYADQTIYNFTEMTRNIGTFTAAGVDLQTSVDSIKGIANLAAMSGSTSQQASTAMYQLSQALAAGKVSLMDWNSVVNAGMGGEIFQNALIRTSELLKTGAKDAIATYGSFRESLTQGEWLTTEVLTETLKQLSGAYTEADLIAQGFTQSQAKEISGLAQTASDAATKVKTFTQLWDVMKESAQSGWAQTWKLIIGDFEEARSFFTPLSETLTGVINKMSDARNSMLKTALTSKWDQLSEKVEAAGISTDTYLEKIKECAEEGGISVESLIKEYGSLTKAIKAGKIPANVFTKALQKLVGSEEKATKSTKELGEVVEKVLNGEFGTGEERIKKLTEAGYDYAEVQNKVNEKLGSSVRHISALTEEQKKNADQLSKLSDEQLKNKGYTDEQIKALRELEKAASDGGTSINELIDAMDKPSGRTLLLESFNNVLKAIGDTLKIVKEAWDEVFKSDEDGKSTGDMLYNIIESVHEFTESLTMSEETAKNFRTVMEGIFTGLSIGNYLVSASLTSGLKILDAVLKLLGTDLLGVAAKIAECIIKFKDWIDENTMLYNGIDKIATVIVAVIEGVGNLISAFSKLEFVQDIIDRIKQAVTDFFNLFSLDFKGLSADDIAASIESAFQKAIDYINNLDLTTTGMDFVMGLVNGIMAGIGNVVEAVTSLGAKALEALMSILGIHSPSRETYEIGENFILGFLNAIRDGASSVWSAIKAFGSKCLEVLNDIGWGKLFAAGVIITALWLFKKLIDVVEMVVSPVKALNDMLKAFGDMAKTIGSTIKGIGGAIEKNINARTLATRSKAILNFALAIGVLAASVWVLSKIEVKDLVKAGIAIGVLAGIMAGLIVLTSKLNKGGDITIKAASILAIAASLVIIAGAFKILASIELDDVPTILATFAIAIGGLFALIAGFGKFTTKGNAAAVSKMGWILMQISVALIIMSTAMKIAASISLKDIGSVAAVMASVAVLFGAMTAISKLAGAHVSKAGSMMIKMAIALGIMVGVIKLAAMLDRGEVDRAIEVMASVSLLFAAIMAISKLAGPNASKAGSMIFKMSLALLAIVGVIKLISGLDPADINRGLETIAKLELMFAGLIAVSKFAGPNAAKAGVMLLMMSGALLILSGVIFILSELDPEGLKRAVTAIAVLEMAFAGLIAVTALAKECKTTLIILTVAIGLLALFLTALSFIDPGDLRNATACISAVMLVFAGLMLATKFVKNTKSMRKTLIELLVIVTILSLIVIGLSYIDPNKALQSTAAVCTMLLSFAGAMVIMSKAGRMSSTISKQILPMLGVVTALALIVAGLSLLDPKSVMTSVTALSMLMISFAGMLTVMSKAGRLSTTVSKQIYPMLGVVAILAGILAALSMLPNVDSLIPIAVSLSILLGALVASLVVLSMAGPAASGAIVPAALMGLVIAELAAILAAMSFLPNVDSLLPTAVALSTLLLALSAACLILIPVGATGPAAIVGAGVLAGVIAILGAVAIAVGELMSYIPMSKIEEWKSGIEKFMDLLSTLAYGLGEVVGSLLGGFASGTLSCLPDIGQHLSDFMTNAQVFIDGAKSVDDSVLKGVGILGGAILALTAADFVNSLSSFATFGSSFVDLGTQLSQFMSNVQPFIDGAKTLDPSVLEGVKSLSTIILTLTSADLIDSLTSWLTGGTSLADFGTDLAAFGKSMQEYSATVTGINAEAITASAEAAKAMAEVAQIIPNMGGLVSMLAGDNTLDTFGVQLVAFGKSMQEYSTAVTGLNTESITVSVEAARSLADMATAIPNFGGLIEMFSGTNDLATFGFQLTSFGSSLVTYAETVAGLQIDGISTSVVAAKAIAKLHDEIPNFGGLVTLFSGSNDYITFGYQISAFGSSLKSYGEKVAGLDLASITASVAAAKSLLTFAKTLPEGGDMSDNIGDFSDNIKKLGKGLDKYSNKVSDVNISKVNGSISAAKSLVSFIKSTAGIDTSGVDKFKSAVEKLATVNFEGLAKTLNSSTSKFAEIGAHIIDALAKGVRGRETTLINEAKSIVAKMVDAFESKESAFQTMGSNMIAKFVSGVNKQKTKATSAMASIAAACVSKIRGYYSQFFSAGSYLAIGFANGITASSFASRARAAAMAQAALDAAKATLAINSPSKEFMKLGRGVGEGFVYGIQDYTRRVYNSSAEMADTAINGFGNAVARISDMVSCDIDAQPTIRPVLDLSDVSAGVNTIGDMLGLTPSVGVMANVGAINTMMNRRNQNGVNGDVVAAIDKLRGELGNVGGTSYNINGVTYNDDSALFDAVQTIVRYAQIERRV